MFEQFTANLTEPQKYLISSLGLFFVFFIVVTILLIRLKKQHVNYMSDMPLEDGSTTTSNSTKS
jgi:hypothetical protein